jgi:hypothetical protein
MFENEKEEAPFRAALGFANEIGAAHASNPNFYRVYRKVVLT